jgi:hypothetical protein
MASIPRNSPGFDVAKWTLGRLSLQLLPLVSNKHPISLLSYNQLQALPAGLFDHNTALE